jgi:hypothetical protein
MTSDSLLERQDLYLERMKAARDRTAVLKATLIELRSSSPASLIFVFEGIDDKFVYASWIRRLIPEMRYEALPCNSKRNVLRLREICKADKTSLGTGVFYFIDRDFDDFGGFAEDTNTFMTDRYAVENYLVTGGVVNDILTNEFHCHAKPKARQRICEIFEQLYASFLEVSKLVNERIFVARRLKVDIIPAIPDKINKIATIELTTVELVNSAEAIIVLKIEPDWSQLVDLRAEFGRLDPEKRYRGKFALKFLLKWLSLLDQEYASRTTDLFRDIDQNHPSRANEITIGTLASRSEIPPKLQAFLTKVGQ